MRQLWKSFWGWLSGCYRFDCLAPDQPVLAVNSLPQPVSSEMSTWLVLLLFPLIKHGVWHCHLPSDFMKLSTQALKHALWWELSILTVKQTRCKQHVELWVLVFIFNGFLHLSERQSDRTREAEIFDHLSHATSIGQLWGCTRPLSRAEESVWVFHSMTGSQALGPSCSTFPGTSGDNCFKGRAARNGTAH